jgi:hypothetical protein
MDNQRNSPRSRTLKTAKVVFNNRRSVVDCIIRNISDDGCCLQISDPLAVPETFEMETGGGWRLCQVVWRKADRIGVKFTDQRNA